MCVCVCVWKLTLNLSHFPLSLFIILGNHSSNHLSPLMHILRGGSLYFFSIITTLYYSSSSTTIIFPLQHRQAPSRATFCPPKNTLSATQASPSTINFFVTPPFSFAHNHDPLSRPTPTTSSSTSIFFCISQTELKQQQPCYNA